MTTYVENSSAFRKYLNENGLRGALRSTGLTQKEKHTVVPHVRSFPPCRRYLLLTTLHGEQRLYAPLDAPADALPSFPDAESWYLQVSTSSCICILVTC